MQVSVYYNDDWSGLYIDGVFKQEDHYIMPYDIANHVGDQPFILKTWDCKDTGLDGEGFIDEGYPDTEQEAQVLFNTSLENAMKARYAREDLEDNDDFDEDEDDED